MSVPPLKVLMVCRSLPCHVRGGLEFHTLDLASGLAARGVRIDLLSCAAGPDYRAELQKRGVGLKELTGPPADHYSLAYLRGVAVEIDRLLDRESYDMVHGQEFGLGFWQPRDGPSAKLTVTVHGTITSETPLHPDVFSELSAGGKLAALARFGRRYLYAPAWRRQLARADAILVDSSFTRGELARMDASLTSKIHFVPLGVDAGRYPVVDKARARRKLGWAGATGGEPVIFTIGRLEWQKGHDLALRALAALKELPWRYVIAGEGARRGPLERLTTNLGIADRVKFAGRVDDRTKSLMLAAADLFLWPERTHPAFGLVGLEALLMGTPVLASRRGAIPEIVDSPKWLFDPSDPQAPARMLRTALAGLGSGGARAIPDRAEVLRRFSLDAMVEGTLAVYENLLRPTR